MQTIVVSLHGCPTACWGLYGNEFSATPHLDRLAVDGIAFDSHFSDKPDPVSARIAWRTGLGSGGVDLLDTLNASGVVTVLVRANREASDTPGFYAGWQKQFDARPNPDDATPTTALLQMLPQVLDELKSVTSFLLWIECDAMLPPWFVPEGVFEVYVEDLVGETAPDEYIEAIIPWVDPSPGWTDTDDFDSWDLLHRSFAAAVTGFDAQLGELFALLRERNLHETATWLVTSDYGYPLGERGYVGAHRPYLHEEFVHLPLIIQLPNAEHAGLRVSDITQPADMMPTILSLLKVENAVGIEGRDLTAHWNGTPHEPRMHAISVCEIDGYGERAIRTADWTYLEPTGHADDDEPIREAMLFARPEDRWEANDVRSQFPDVTAQMQQLLADHSPGGAGRSGG